MRPCLTELAPSTTARGWSIRYPATPPPPIRPTFVNLIQRVYNGLGQLTAEYQSHSGAAKTASTPVTQYSYSDPSTGSKLISMTYPDGYQLHYNYASGIDSAIGRLSSLSDANGTLEAY